jgi:hypothetical protein
MRGRLRGQVWEEEEGRRRGRAGVACLWPRPACVRAPPVGSCCARRAAGTRRHPTCERCAQGGHSRGSRVSRRSVRATGRGRHGLRACRRVGTAPQDRQPPERPGGLASGSARPGCTPAGGQAGRPPPLHRPPTHPVTLHPHKHTCGRRPCRPAPRACRAGMAARRHRSKRGSSP